MNFWRKGKLAIARAMGLDVTHSQTHYARFLAGRLDRTESWLDVGCGRQLVPYDKMPLEQQRSCFGRVKLLVGLDVDDAILEHPLLRERVIGLCGSLPFAADSFDLVTANMVAEHVPDPNTFLTDIRRVLRPSGQFIFHTPNANYYLVALARMVPGVVKHKIIWILEGRTDQDIFETHYQLNTPQRIMQLAAAAGFEVDTLNVTGSDGAFGALGPLGWAECVMLKLLSVVGRGQYNSNLIVSLRKPPVS